MCCVKEQIDATHYGGIHHYYSFISLLLVSLSFSQECFDPGRDVIPVGQSSNYPCPGYILIIVFHKTSIYGMSLQVIQ